MFTAPNPLPESDSREAGAVSIAVMNWVWARSPVSGSERLVLLALADACSRDDGTGCWPYAEFSTRGTARWLLTPPVRNPAEYCGPLWTDASGGRLLTSCGDTFEYAIHNRHLTKIHKPWQLPTYNTPTAPFIAW